jgi:hypothetical protein
MYDRKPFESEVWKEIINNRKYELGDISESEKMAIINEELSMSWNNEQPISPYMEKDIFLVKLTENVDITQRELDMSQILRYSDYCYGNLNLLKRHASDLLSYSDVCLLTWFLQLLNKYDNMIFFLRDMTIKEYNEHVKVLKYDDEKTLLSL